MKPASRATAIAFVLSSAIAIACPVAARAQVFVSNYNGNTVSEYNYTGTFLRTFVTAGSGNLSGASNLAFGPDGNLYVTSSRNGAIKKYDGATGTYLGDLISSLTTPYDLAFGSDGFLYVPDYGTNAAYKINATTGAILQTYTGGLSRPEGIALLANGNLVVGSGIGANSVLFDRNTGTSSTFATGSGVNVGVTTGPDGRVYYSEYSSGAIGVVSALGGSVSTFTSGGTLSEPQYMAFGNNSLYVASYVNNTVQYFNATTGAYQGSFASSNAVGVAIKSNSVSAPEPGSAILMLSAGIGVFAPFCRRHRKRG